MKSYMCSHVFSHHSVNINIAEWPESAVVKQPHIWLSLTTHIVTIDNYLLLVKPLTFQLNAKGRQVVYSSFLTNISAWNIANCPKVQ